MPGPSPDMTWRDRLGRLLPYNGALSLGVIVGLILLTHPGSRAADALPYTVTLESTGNSALDRLLRDASTLISLAKTAPVGPFALVGRARADRERFVTALHSDGYYDGAVTVTINDVPLDSPGIIDSLDNATQAGVKVAFTLGPLFHLGAVTVTGDIPPGFSDQLGIKPGDPARAAAVLDAGERLLTALRAAGYALAKVEPPVATLRPADRLLDVAFAVEAGRRVDLGPIAIDGLKNVHEGYARDELPLRQGELFSPQKIEAARAKLASLGVFSEVRAEPATSLDAAGQLPVTFVVTEAPPRTVKLGLSYSTDLGASASAAWQHHNLFGNGEQLNLTATASAGGTSQPHPGYQLGAQFIRPDFLHPDQTFQAELVGLKQNLQAYDQQAVLETITIARKDWPWPHWTAHVGLAGEQEYIVQEAVGRHYNLIGVPMGLGFDNTNDLLNPTKGMRAAITAEPMHSLSYGGATFAILQISGSTYFDLTGNGRSVIALRGLFGALPGAGIFSLPPDQRFYAGGIGTVRGFRYQSVGPQFSDEHPTGGTSVAAGTVELRQRLWGNWGMAAFVDAGEVTASGLPYSGTWRFGAGLGVRYFTSIGPIRLDVAVPINRQPGGDAFELYVGLGEAF
jgi:translocation and assembly module TamA